MISTKQAISPQTQIHLVEDDDAVRRAIVAMISAEDYACVEYPNGEDFLTNSNFSCPSCVLLDLRLPGMSGLEVLRRLNEGEQCPPVTMISGKADVATAVAAMRGGALDFLEKPIKRARLVEVIRLAMIRDIQRRKKLKSSLAFRSRLMRLTAKEKAVFQLLLDGCLNKQIASNLDLSVRTIEMRRASIFQKLEVSTLSELFQLAYGRPSFRIDSESLLARPSITHLERMPVADRSNVAIPRGEGAPLLGN